MAELSVEPGVVVVEILLRTPVQNCPLTSSCCRAKEIVRQSHGQPFVRAHFSISRWPPSAARQHVCASHGQSFACAHFNISKWAPCAAPARPLVPRATVCVKPFQRLELPKRCAHRGVPLLPAGEQPLDDFDIPTLRGPQERVKVPPFDTVWPPQAFRTQPLQNLELATSRGDSVQLAHIRYVNRRRERYMCYFWSGQKTILMQTFQHAYASDLRSLESVELLHFTPRRVHRVAHRATHRSKSGQNPWCRVESQI